MRRNKERKGRLDKGSSSVSEFVGFSAFARPESGQQEQGGRTASQLQWSPVYTGSDSQISLLFKKIGQKRDSVTKARALAELENYFQSDEPSRKDQVAAFSHFCFVYHSKLTYDGSSSVRSSALSCLIVARSRVPKAWNSLWEQHHNLQGMVWCAREDPAAEVRAVQLDNDVVFSRLGVCSYAEFILGFGRARNLYNELFGRKRNPEEMSDAEREQADEHFERIVGTAISGLGSYVHMNPERSDGPLYNEQFNDDLLWKTLINSKSSLRKKTYSLVCAFCQNVPSVAYNATSKLPTQIVNSVGQERDAVNVPSMFEMLLVYLTSAAKAKGSRLATAFDYLLLCRHINKMLRKACYGAAARIWGPSVLPFMASLPSNVPDHVPFHLHHQLLSSLWQGREEAISSGDVLCIVTAVSESAEFLLLGRVKEPSETMEETTTVNVAGFFLKALGHFLAPSRVSVADQDVHLKLGQTLARGLCKMEQSSVHRSDRAFFSIQSWFWDEAFRSLLDSKGADVNRQLTVLIQCLYKEQDRLRADNEEAADISRLREPFRAIFWSIVDQNAGTSGSFPSIADYDCLIEILRYCGVSYIFAKVDLKEQGGTQRDTSIDHFLTNDLLRWIIVHSSSLSREQHSGHMLERDFELLRTCLPSMASDQRKSVLWKSMLTEMVAAKCDLDLLAGGIVILLRQTDNESSNEWETILRSNDILEDLALQAAKSSATEYRRYPHISTKHDDLASDEVSATSSEEDGTLVQKGALFLEACVGLSPGASSMLIGDAVIQQWINIACASEDRNVQGPTFPPRKSNVLLETLVSLIVRGGRLAQSQTEVVLVQCWREGGDVWSSALKLLDDECLTQSSGEGARDRVLNILARETQETLRQICSSRANVKSDAMMCLSWSELAWRLLQIHMAKRTEYDKRPAPSGLLALTGLGVLDLWDETLLATGSTSPDQLHLCLFYVLEQINEPIERWKLIMQPTENGSAKLLVCMLMSMARGVFFAAHELLPADDRGDRLISSLGGSENIPIEIVLESFQETVKRLGSDMQRLNDETYGRACSAVFVLSELVDILLPRVGKQDADKVSAADLREGDTLWYMPDQGNESKRERAHIIKIHSDDFPNLYFTLRVEGESKNGSASERQTVASRLRRLPAPVSPKIPADLAAADAVGAKLSDTMMQLLVRPYLSSASILKKGQALELAGECLNTIVSQCRLPRSDGVGSIRYEIFQIATLLESQICNQQSEFDLFPSLLLAVSSLMGSGRLTKASRTNFETLGFDPTRLVLAVFDYPGLTEQSSRKKKFDRAVLSWLTIALPMLQQHETIEHSVTLAYKLGVSLLSSELEAEEKTKSLFSSATFVFKAVMDIQLQRVAAEGQGDELVAAEKSLYSRIVEVFIELSDAEDDITLNGIIEDEPGLRIPVPAWHSSFASILDFALQRRMDFFVEAAWPHSDQLVELLFEPSKRGLAFRILHAVSKRGRTINESNSPLRAGTATKLKLWQDKLLKEEAEELEEDVLLAHAYLPGRLMEELEKWEDLTLSDVDANDHFGMMTSWLLFLSFLDGVSAADPAVRGALGSYIHNCRAATVALSISLFYLKINSDRKNKSSSITSLERLWTNQDSLGMSQLSELVVFRTAEVLPTLFKHWWMDDCPKKLAKGVSDFVERRVAPDALKRELVRIKKATNLGEMTVAGSGVSREIAATYVQDECQLSIAIQIPPNFPLRNVEVDGQKTFGIPEKRWKRWALQIGLMLNNQDGTILDALMLWKENVDKEFEGVEPCPVCYSVLSVKTHELPKLECKTCKNRFHASCLYKWFHSSGKSQCVICQQPWSGTRIQ